MTKLNQLVQRYALAALALSFVVGVLLGLVVLGWWLWPVQYKPPTPADLSEAWRRDYVSMVADSFAQTGDAATARQRLEGLLYPGQDAADLGQQILALAQQQAAIGAEDAARLEALAGLLQAPAAEVIPTTAPGTPVTPAQTPNWVSRLAKVLGLVILVLVILAGLLLLVYLLQSRTAAPPVEEEVETRLSTAAAGPATSSKPARSTATAAPPTVSPVPALTREPTVAPAEPVPAPAAPTALGPYVATYNLGDIDFDMSFGIESAGGDFLGECGLGMAETIGSGDVQRVTAFEVWLFDKTDIRTVSLVVASAHAHGDQALRAKLSSRGEVVLADRGATFAIKTSTLRLEGRVLDLAYGGGDGPAQSYFTSLSVELRPILLAGEEGSLA